MDSVSRDRAHMPEKANAIINQRTLQASNKRLAQLVKPGMKVLDVGCGNGAITVGIAEAAGETGYVVGVDNNVRLIEEANLRQEKPSWLSFATADIYELPYENDFDIVVSSRVLQWLSDPQLALQQMIRAAKPGGTVLVLDYNHEKLSWTPEPPASMRLFYRQFLQWRSDAGMDNAVADKLEKWFEACQLTNVRVSDQSERLTRQSAQFEAGASIWAVVAASRGVQMVQDNYVTDNERRLAEEEYREWVRTVAEEHTMYVLAVEGEKPFL